MLSCWFQSCAGGSSFAAQDMELTFDLSDDLNVPEDVEHTTTGQGKVTRVIQCQGLRNSLLYSHFSH